MYKSLAKTLFVGKKLVFLTTCHSTNELAAENLRKQGLADGSIFITDNQTHGRGQMQNIWYSEPGKNLTFSLVFYPGTLRAKDQFSLNAAVSLGITDALGAIVPDILVKWPNDIYVQDQKLGGILIQNTLRGEMIESSIIGIGLNVNQMQFEIPTAVSLRMITGKTYVLQDLLEEICHAIEQRYLQLRKGDERRLIGEYRDGLYRFGQDCLYKADEVFMGRIVDIMPSGELLMDTDDGQRKFQFKEVQFL